MLHKIALTVGNIWRTHVIQGCCWKLCQYRYICTHFTTSHCSRVPSNMHVGTCGIMAVVWRLQFILRSMRSHYYGSSVFFMLLLRCFSVFVSLSLSLGLFDVNQNSTGRTLKQWKERMALDVVSHHLNTVHTNGIQTCMCTGHGICEYLSRDYHKWRRWREATAKDTAVRLTCSRMCITFQVQQI